MKQNFFFLSLIAFGVIAGCNTKSNNKEDASIAGTDSSMMSTDNANVAVTTADTMAKVSSTSTDTVTTGNTANPNSTKKGKKGKVTITLPAAGTGEMTPDKEGYYTNTEILPSFPGGQKALENFLLKNIQYPAEASDNGVEGTVNINFSVDENGKIYTPKVVSPNLGYGLEKEALAALNKMPKWTPGRIKGKNVKTRYTLPVTFMLSE
jgi:periplasmic protein TonB